MIAGLVKHLSNLPGWRTKRKIVVIESDDWGSIRMPSHDAYQKVKSHGVNLDSGSGGRYNRYDTLASKEDLCSLFEVLSRVKDKNGNHAKFTAVSLVANPDFKKIADNDFKEYYFEPFTDTLNRYGLEDAFSGWQEGIKNCLFVPQFHGREHLNICAWMRALQNKDEKTCYAFKHGLWGFNNNHNLGINYQAAFDLEKPNDLKVQSDIIISGLNLFEKIFKYKASFFVPPNGPINNSLEKVLMKNGVQFISSSKIQREVFGNGKLRIVIHYIGQQNKYQQYYLTRNCFFEPSANGKDWVESCLSEINIAFKWKKPAIISSHRVNYIGSLNSDNRDKGLFELNRLLESILRKWPDIEFMTSNELGQLIRESNSSST